MSRQIVVSWEHPTTEKDIIADNIVKYVVRTDFNGENNFYREVEAPANSLTYNNIDPGFYTVEIEAVSDIGRKSAMYAETIEVREIKGSSDDSRTIGGVSLGGSISCPTFFRGVGDSFVFYIQQHDWTFKPSGKDSIAATNFSGIEDTYKQPLNNLPILSNLEITESAEISGILPSAHYILLSADDTIDKLRLIKLETRHKDFFWYDAGTGEKSDFVGQSNSSYGVALTGTISVAGSTVTGNNTDFLGELIEGDTIFSTQHANDSFYIGKVSQIISKTELKIASPEKIEYIEDNTFGRVNLRIDPLQDSIIARVYKTGQNTYEHELMTTLDTTLVPSLSPTSQSSTLIAHFTFDSMINNKVVGVNKKVSNFVAEVVGSGALITSESPIGNAILLDGSQYVRLLRDNFAYRHTNNSGGDFVMWFRSDSTSGENDAILIGRKNLWSLQLNQSGSGDQTISLVDETTSSTLMSSVVSQGAWHQVALSTDDYTQENRYKAYLYIDRIPIASLDEDSVLLPNDSSEPDGNILLKPLTIGGWASGNNGFVGAFTDVWLANRSFSDSEIGSLWSRQGTENSSSGRPFKMGEGINSIQIDENGIVVGGTDTSDSPFSVTTAGAIDATSGEVAGWKLSASSIYSGTRPYTSEFSACSGITLRKTGSIHAKNFYIDNDGDAFFKGNISACSGQIGGWQIHEEGLFSSNLSFASNANITASGFLNNNGIVIHNQGSLHSRNFFINSDGTSSFSGDISGATGTFSGGAGEGTITGSEIQDGSVDANELASEGIAGYNISPSGTIAVFNRTGAGNIIPSSYAALDGADSNFRIYAGNDNPRLAPFRVSKEGQITADNLQLFDSNNNIYFDSNTGGFTPSAITQFARNFSTPISTASDLFTGNVDKTDATTFQELVLTASTELVTSLSIPTTKMSSKVSEEYFGNRSNPLTITVDVSTLAASGQTNLTRASSIKKPGGDALDRAVKIGELVRLNLENTVSGMNLTSVTGAINALTGSAFTSNYTIPGPSKFGYLLFEINGGSVDFTFNINSNDTANIVMDAETSAHISAKPDTEATALANIPNTVTFGLNRSTGSAEAAATQVIAPVSISKVSTGTPTSSQFLAKTLTKDIVDVDTIHSTVGVVPGGAIDAEGFFTTGTDTETLLKNKYFYHSTLTFSGGNSSFYPINRLFKITSNDGKLIPGQGESALTQSSQNSTVQDLTLGGGVFSPHATTISPTTNAITGSAGTVTIAGNLHVTGVQTTVTQQDLTISDKHITLASGASAASDIDTAGVIVDRTGISQTDASLAWNETNDEWEISNQVSCNRFRSDIHGTAGNPVFKFGTKVAGLWASDEQSGDNTNDQINVTITNSDSVQRTAFFNNAGFTSSYNVYTSDGAAFRNIGGTWLASTGADPSSAGDFKFINTHSGNDIPIMTLSSQQRRVGIGRTDPQVPLDVKQSQQDIARFESSTSAAIVTIKSAGGSTKPTSILFDNTNASLKMTATSGSFLDISKTTSSVSKFSFADAATNPAVKITRQHNPVGATNSVPTNAALQIHNPYEYDAETQGRGYQGSGVVFTDYLNSDVPVCQRGYIFCGPNQQNAGYGFMEFGIQHTEQYPTLNSSTGLSRSLTLSRGGHAGINCIGVNDNLEVTSLQGAHGFLAVSGDASDIGTNFATIRFKNTDNSGKTSKIIAKTTTQGSNLRFTNYQDIDAMSLDTSTGHLKLGTGTTIDKGTLNMGHTSQDTTTLSFSAGHAANSTALVFSVADIKAAKVFAHVNEGATEFCSELNILCSGSNAYATEYGVICSDGSTKNISFSVGKSGEFYTLTALNTSGGAKTLKFHTTYHCT